MHDSMYKMRYDVAFALAGDIMWNSRALKQLRLFERMGLRVVACGIGREEKQVTPFGAVQVHTLPRPAGHGPKFFWAVHRMIEERFKHVDASVYHASDLYTLPALATLARKRKANLVYDARELYPNVASTAGRPWVRWFWKSIEGHYIRHVDRVFTVSNSIRDRIVQRYGVEPPRVLFNVPGRVVVEPSEALRNAAAVAPDIPILLHQGNMQKDRGCFKLVDAMKLVPGGVLVFMGGGPLRDAIQSYIEEQRLTDRVYLLPPVAPEQLLSYTASATVGITLLEDTCLNHRFALPNKLFEYLVAGIPVVASRLPEIQQVVEGFDVGYLVNPANPESIAAALRSVVENPEILAEKARNIPRVLETFSWEKASERFVSSYQTLLSGEAS